MYIESDRNISRPKGNIFTNGSFEAAIDMMLIHVGLGYQPDSQMDLANKVLIGATKLSQLSRESEQARRDYIRQTTRTYRRLSVDNDEILERTKHLEAMLHIVLAVPAADMSKSARK